jgi:hypothetical protein
MRRQTDSTEALVRRAFDLLLKLRSMPEGPRLLPCAVAFLEMLVRQPRSQQPPLVVTVRAMQVRRA